MSKQHLTREQVCERAQSIFDSCFYVWGGYPDHYGTCTSKTGQTASGRPTDCSGFISWAWGLGEHVNSSAWKSGSFASNFVPKAQNNGTIEEMYPGIQPGDVLVRSEYTADGYRGHVALYLGNNTVMEYYTGYWEKTPNKQGGRVSNYAENFMGYCRYDESFSGEYDDENDDYLTYEFNEGGQSVPLDGPVNPPFTDGSPGDISDWTIHYLCQYQYIRRYWKCKTMRRY